MTNSCPCCQASQQTKTFLDPVPAGNTVTNISITYWATDCGASTIPTYINGAYIGATPAAPYDCACGSCHQYALSKSYPCGLTGYVYGGVNTLYCNPNYTVCIQRVVI